VVLLDVVEVHWLDSRMQGPGDHLLLEKTGAVLILCRLMVVQTTSWHFVYSLFCCVLFVLSCFVSFISRLLAAHNSSLCGCSFFKCPPHASSSTIYDLFTRREAMTRHERSIFLAPTDNRQHFHIIEEQKTILNIN